MTICFDSYYEMKKFCSKLFNGQIKDNTLPVFSECNFDFNFKSVHVKCDMTENELSQWLKEMLNFLYSEPAYTKLYNHIINNIF